VLAQIQKGRVAQRRAWALLPPPTSDVGRVACPPMAWGQLSHGPPGPRLRADVLKGGMEGGGLQIPQSHSDATAWVGRIECPREGPQIGEGYTRETGLVFPSRKVFLPCSVF
jgi:hypothetical protein